MGTGSKLPGASMPPATDHIDIGWDDDPIDTAELVDGPDEDDRPTFTPDEPAEQFAARVMAEAGEQRVPAPSGLEFDLSDREEYLSPPRVPVFDARAAPPVRPATVDPAPRTETTDWSSARHYERHSAPTPLSRDRVPTEPPESPPARGRLSYGDLGLELDPESGAPSPLAMADSHPRSTAPPPPPSSLELAVDPKQSVRPVTAEGGDALNDMKDRYAVGDFTGALVIAESVLETDPDDMDAKRYAQSCREVLTQMYAARLGTLDQVVSVAIPADQIRWLSLDHRAGFLLSLVDGMSSIEEVLDVSGMTRLDALRILYTLVQQRVITLESA